MTRPHSSPNQPEPIDIASLLPPFAPTDAATTWLFRLHRLGIRPGLTSITEVLDRMGNPQRECPAVVVAGTNGKGSAALALAAMLGSCGQRVGLYTSPHFLRIHERIRVGNEAISPADLFALVSEYRGLLESGGTTFFESLTALAFEHFRREACDIVVLEAGLGGRLDATKVARKIGVVVTSVGLDHQDLLGHSEDAIATEKLGLAEAGVPLYLLSNAEPLRRLAVERATAVGCELMEAEPAAITVPENLESPRLRSNYRRVARVAIDLARRLDLPAPSFAEAAEVHCLPGRYERRGSRPELRLDSAHNAHALLPLLHEFAGGEHSDGPTVLLFSATEGKSLDGVFDTARELFDHILCVSPRWPRAVSSARLAEEMQSRKGGAEVEALPSVCAGLERAREFAQGGRALVCGSNFLVAEALDRLGIDDIAQGGSPLWDAGLPLRRRFTAVPVESGKS